MSDASLSSIVLSIWLIFLTARAQTFTENVPFSNETLHPATTSRLNSESENLLNTEKVMKDAMTFSKSFCDGNFLRNLRSESDWNISSQCYSHLLMTADALREEKTWALKLIDASGKSPSGIFNWKQSDFGDFDGCLAVNVSGLFQGKYCLAVLAPPALNPGGFDLEMENAADEQMVTDVFTAEEETENAIFRLRISVCLPSTCSSEDLSLIASKILKDDQVNMSVGAISCQVKERLKLETGDYICIVAVGMVILTMVVGSLIDLYLMHQSQGKSHRENSRLLVRCFVCFSICWNTERLLKADKSTNSIKLFYGLKVIASLWVILGHTYLTVPYLLFAANDFQRRVRGGLLFQAVDNPFPIVGVFFFISGALVVYGRMMMKNERVSIPLYIFHRIWRITPLVMFTVALQALVYRLGSGPFWTVGFGREVRNCWKNWWSVLLFVNNFTNATEPCAVWTWYLSADTQLYIIALIVVLPIKRHPKTALGILATLAVLGVASSVASNLYFKLPGDFIAGAHSIYDVMKFLAYGYFPTFQHLFGYAVGMASGYVLYHGYKFHVSAKTNTACWSLACVFAAISVYSSYAFYFIPEPSWPAAAIYQPACGVLWSLSLAWLTISCFPGRGGFVNKFLSWGPLGPLSRLTFAVYLVHPIILEAYAYSTRFPIQSDHRTLVFFYLGNVLASYIAGYFISMLVEAPLLALEKVLLRRPTPANAANEVHEEDHTQKVNETAFMKIQETVAEAGKTAILWNKKNADEGRLGNI